MPDFVVSHTPGWLDYFGRQGHVPTALAAGVEGAIYDLGGGLVAKVWRDRPVPELERMQRFYADVASASLPFATPEIRRIDQVNGTSVTYCKPQLASHPAFAASVATLRGMGVQVLFDPGAPYERRIPPWEDVTAALPVLTAAG